MAKTCIKKDLKKLENEIDDLIMLEDSARGTLCAIHKTIHSTENFPSSKHQMMKLCPVPKCCPCPQARPIRSRRKSRSQSPCCDPKMYRALSANDSLRKHCCIRPHVYVEKSNISRPRSRSTHHVDIEKTVSCPGKMCVCSKNQPYCTVTSRSSIHVDEFTKSLVNTDEIVNDLRGEIEKVKHQIHHISRQRTCLSDKGKSKIPCLIKPCSPTPTNAEEHYEADVAKLRHENKRLKREIDAKKKLLDKSRSDMTKAKDILKDYEKKVNLLQIQAVKSSKAMKMCKDKFCHCLKDREERINSLKEINSKLEKSMAEKQNLLSDKEKELQLLSESIDMLKTAFEQTSQKCSSLTETNQGFLDTIEELKSQLLNSSTQVDKQKMIIQTLEQRASDLNCICKKVVTRTKKQKDMYQAQIKESEEKQLHMEKEITDLSAKVKEVEKQKNFIDELQCKCQELQGKIQDYEKYSEKCKELEAECKKYYEQMQDSEKSFQKDKQEMEKLIYELSNVVKQNKVTLMQMTDINKQQENIIKNQSIALLTKEEQLKLMENQSEDFKMKNRELEEQVEYLRKSFSEPCSREACLCISRELSELRNALTSEKDTQLLKEKIIQDQSQTILNLQSQVKEKMSELSKAQSDTKYLEIEISRINDKLIQKHEELDTQIDEKEHLIERLRILECQRNQLSEEIADFEDMLKSYKDTCGDNEKQQEILNNLQEEIAIQRKEWEIQKEIMAKEKQKAVFAAKFATQKLLDTVSDFQRQVNAQKRVQHFLTKMLHEKDEQLRAVKSKISNINSITRDDTIQEDKEHSMQELFFRSSLGQPSDVNTNTTMYSSCSSCKGECLANHISCRENNYFNQANRKLSLGTYSNIHQEIIKVLSDNVQENPSRDVS